MYRSVCNFSGVCFNSLVLYLAEEMNADDGEMVIGFCVKKTSHSPEREKIMLALSYVPLSPFFLFFHLFYLCCLAPPLQMSKKPFSLDFPPGLVDLDSKAEATSEQWNSIKKVLGRN